MIFLTWTIYEMETANWTQFFFISTIFCPKITSLFIQGPEGLVWLWHFPPTDTARRHFPPISKEMGDILGVLFFYCSFPRPSMATAAGPTDRVDQ